MLFKRVFVWTMFFVSAINRETQLEYYYIYNYSAVRMKHQDHNFKGFSAN